jgi:hypothetical protein
MAAELERIEAELALQDRALEELRAVTASYGDVELAVPRAALDEIESACAPSAPCQLGRAHTVIRC